MRYPLNQSLLNKVKEKLQDYKKIYWIVGGACAGKSTVCRELSKKYNSSIYDMDEHIFGKYQSRYTDDLHPANRAWFTASNPLDWNLSHESWDEMNEFNEAAMVEYLHLFSQDVENVSPNKILIVDGGVTNPAILAQVFSSKQIICLKIDNHICSKIWEEDIERQPMKEMVLKLDNPEDKWKKFLMINHFMNDQIVNECIKHQIKIIHRHESTTTEEIINIIKNELKIK